MLIWDHWFARNFLLSSRIKCCNSKARSKVRKKLAVSKYSNQLMLGRRIWILMLIDSHNSQTGNSSNGNSDKSSSSKPPKIAKKEKSENSNQQSRRESQRSHICAAHSACARHALYSSCQFDSLGQPRHRLRGRPNRSIRLYGPFHFYFMA